VFDELEGPSGGSVPKYTRETPARTLAAVRNPLSLFLSDSYTYVPRPVTSPGTARTPHAAPIRRYAW
jgi:hypothetical protein